MTHLLNFAAMTCVWILILIPKKILVVINLSCTCSTGLGYNTEILLADSSTYDKWKYCIIRPILRYYVPTTAKSLMFVGIDHDVCVFETKPMFIGINICGLIPFSSGLVNYLCTYLNYVCWYLFWRFKCGCENREMNPSQILMDLQYCSFKQLFNITL